MTKTSKLTPLQRAQHFTAINARVREETIHSLRSAGWSRVDATERADELEARAFERWEAANRR